ncbi:MAG: hypothetical protein LC749_12615, partial [Actinobacteria bacterium]|nr:hypothetical protein [Actinomycetota bacterium]
RDLLRALCLTMAGGPIGALKLAEASSMSIESVRSLEQHLFKEGLMWFDGRGRKASVLAYKLLSDTDPDGRVYAPPMWVVGWSRDRGLTDEAWLDAISGR